MKIYNKNNLQLKPLNERINGFTVTKGQITLKEELTTAISDSSNGNIDSGDIAKASEGEDSGDTVEVGGDKLDGSVSTNRATFSASGCKKNPSDPKSPLDQNKVNAKIQSLKSDPNVNKLGGLKNVNIDFSHRMPRPTLESVNRLRNNSVSYTKGELNKIILNN